MGEHSFAGEPNADQARIARIEAALLEADRLARAEAKLAAIEATLAERRIAEQAAAAAIQQKLQETEKAASDALKSALDSANVIELERVGRVDDRVAAAERAAEVALTAATAANQASEANAKETLDQHNGLIDKMSSNEAKYQTITAAHTQQQNTDDKISQLRSRLDSGPRGLAELQTIADRSSGRNDGKLDARALTFAVLGVILTLAIIISPHIK